MKFSVLAFLLVSAHGAFLSSPNFPERSGVLDDGVGGFGSSLALDMQKLINRASKDESTLQNARSRNADLTDNITDTKNALRINEENNAITSRKGLKEDHSTTKLQSAYRRKMNSAYLIYKRGTHGLRRKFHQCHAQQTKVNASLTEVSRDLSAARKWRSSAEASMNSYKENGRRLREVVANATAEGLVDLSRSRNLEISLAHEAQAASRTQASANETSQKMQQMHSTLEVDGGQLSDLLKSEESLSFQIKHAQSSLGMQANQYSKKEAAYGRDALRMHQDLAKVRSHRIEAETNTTNAIENLQESRDLYSSSVAKRAEAQEALQNAQRRADREAADLRLLQAELLSAQKLLAEGLNRVNVVSAEAAAQSKAAKRLVQANAKLEVVLRRIDTLEKEHRETVASTHVWKQKVKDLNGTLSIMTRLTKEFGLTRAELATRVDEVLELNRTKARVADETKRERAEAEDLNATEAQLATAALNRKLLEAAEKAVLEQTRELNATQNKLGFTIFQSKKLNSSRNELAIAIEAARNATITEGGMAEERAKERAILNETRELEETMQKAVADSKALAQLEREALEQDERLKASRASEAYNAKELKKALAEMQALKGRAGEDGKKVEAHIAQEVAAMAELKSQAVEGVKAYDIARKAEADLAKELADVKEALAVAKNSSGQARSKESPKAQAASTELARAQAEQNSTAQNVLDLEQQTAEAKDLIIKDVHLLTRCREHGKAMKTDLEAGFRRDQKAFQAEVQTKYEAMARELTKSKKEQAALVEQNKALTKLMGELREQVAAPSN